jgi:hypothetical protein
VKRALLLGLLLAITACPVENDPADFNDAGDEAFVKRVVPLMWGRAPVSIHEVQVLVDVIAATDRGRLVRAMTRSPEYLEHWQDNLMDMTGTSRTYIRANIDCYDESSLDEDTTELAVFVRDNGAQSSFGRPWTMYDLGRSALLLDDLSPWFEADLFAHIVWDGPAMNAVETEAIRLNLAELFQRNYLNREMTCLGCHNSESSVTGSDDPELDRTWEVEGSYEAPLYGASEGMEMSRLHGFFRRDGVVLGPTTGTDEEEPPPFDPEVTTPWGGEPVCGAWGVPEDVNEDRLGLSAFFVEEAGTYASMWDLEPLLRSGMDSLRGTEIAVGNVSGTDSFATLLALSVAEKVWAEAFGFDLTLGHGFPRNEAQRDLLTSLADTWVASSYSLVELLSAVALHPYFAQNPPASVVESESAYYLAPLFDPFSVEDEDPARQGNSTGDIVRRKAPRVVLRSAYHALGWELLPDFPEPQTRLGPDNGLLVYFDDAWVQQALGLKMKDSASGFRNVDFQTLLTWESWFGNCTNPLSEDADWIDGLIEHAVSEGASGEQALSALKDRILTDPDLSDPDERVLLEALLGGPLDLEVPGNGNAQFEEGLRRICGVWLSSPQFQLGGPAGPSRLESPPSLTVPGSSYLDQCVDLSEALFEDGGMRCGSAELQVD